MLQGTTWMGENLVEERDYCDLSLYFDNKELIKVLKALSHCHIQPV